MAVKELEIILARQFADALSTPIFITDVNGNLLFYNEPAEEILGKEFKEVGQMTVDVWSKLFDPIDKDGNKMDASELPLVKTLAYCQPAQGTFGIKNLKGERSYISVTSFPLIGRSSRFVGAVAIFWKKDTL